MVYVLAYLHTWNALYHFLLELEMVFIKHWNVPIRRERISTDFHALTVTAEHSRSSSFHKTGLGGVQCGNKSVTPKPFSGLVHVKAPMSHTHTHTQAQFTSPRVPLCIRRAKMQWKLWRRRRTCWRGRSGTWGGRPKRPRSRPTSFEPRWTWRRTGWRSWRLSSPWWVTARARTHKHNSLKWARWLCSPVCCVHISPNRCTTPTRTQSTHAHAHTLPPLKASLRWRGRISCLIFCAAASIPGRYSCQSACH